MFSATFVRLRRLVIVSAPKPMTMPARIDSHGNPGIVGVCRGVCSEVVTVETLTAVVVSTDVLTPVVVADELVLDELLTELLLVAAVVEELLIELVVLVAAPELVTVTTVVIVLVDVEGVVLVVD